MEQTLVGLFWLVTVSLMGEGLAHFFAAPVPGSVIGLLMLLLALCAMGRIPEPIAQASRLLITLLPLLVVPAGAGLMAQSALRLNDLAAIAAAVLFSTCAGLLVAGWVAGKVPR